MIYRHDAFGLLASGKLSADSCGPIWDTPGDSVVVGSDSVPTRQRMCSKFGEEK
jgi:hypothetical protein